MLQFFLRSLCNCGSKQFLPFLCTDFAPFSDPYSPVIIAHLVKKDFKILHCGRSIISCMSLLAENLLSIKLYVQHEYTCEILLTKHFQTLPILCMLILQSAAFIRLTRPTFSSHIVHHQCLQNLHFPLFRRHPDKPGQCFTRLLQQPILNVHLIHLRTFPFECHFLSFFQGDGQSSFFTIVLIETTRVCLNNIKLYTLHLRMNIRKTNHVKPSFILA